MKELSNVRSVARLLTPVASLLLALSAGDAAGNTYFRCVDGKGAVTVQQTACAVTSSQEERKVWSSTTSHPTSAAPSAHVRPSEEAPKPKLR